MNSEIEAPVILSWLKSSKKCQTIQLNWEASSESWELFNRDIIEEVIHSSKEFFYERYQLNLFNDNSSPLEFLHQRGIEVLGLETQQAIVTNIYGVNTAFYEVGLGNPKNTLLIENVLKNMVRTAMLIHGYYNLSKGAIIFAAPKLHQSIEDSLTHVVKSINEIFKVYGFQFTFTIYVNEDFTNHFINPNVYVTETQHVKTKTWKNTPSSGLVEYLQKSGYEVLDKREKGGALWVIGGEELEHFIEELSVSENIKFSFAKKGSKSTKNVPAWFTKSTK
ncbi:hypothetical protein [Bacillus sp. X1(2014)]|uniref:hypothetical protein n=1 Tax=Bacillus sp. X1(2014) TaxID=1565991 RepID=UPI0011A04650|nr:hypothetical protein [Bacillus sp. X1(2014)]